MTVMRENYFRLTDFSFSDYIAVSCHPRVGDVRIESDGKFQIERDGVTVRGDVLSPTTITLEVLGRGCRGIPPVDLHPVR